MRVSVARLGLVFAAVAFMAQTGCGLNKAGSVAPTTKLAIINGEPVAATDEIALSTVALYFNYPNSRKVVNFCTGSIVGDQRILSAAHCFVDASMQVGVPLEQFVAQVYVGFGTEVVASLDDTKVAFVKVLVAAVHPEYIVSPTKYEDAANGIANPDIAVLSLAANIPASARVVPMVTDISQISTGTQLTLAGFGVTSNPPAASNAVSMNKTDVVVENATLNPVQFRYMTTNGKSACFGDSGGPAFLRGSDGRLYVAGVTSWGDGECSKYGVYSSVPALMPWVSTQL